MISILLSRCLIDAVSDTPERKTCLRTISALEDFLKRHKRVLNITQQAMHETILTAYLVTRCWQKMSRRMVTWSSQGYIYHLGQILDNILEERLSRTIPSGLPVHPNRHDEYLSGMVLYMVGSGLMESAIMKECGRSDCRSTF
jgi:hypothetical protein